MNFSDTRHVTLARIAPLPYSFATRPSIACLAFNK